MKKGKVTVVAKKPKQTKIEEFEPPTTSRKWKKLDGTKYSQYTEKLNIEYTITKEYFDTVKSNEKLYKEKSDDKSERKIIRIIKVTKDNDIFITQTEKTVIDYITSAIIYSDTTALTKRFGSLIGLKAELIELLLLDENEKLDKIFLKERVQIYEGKDISIYGKIKSLLKELIDKEKINDKQKIRIYKLTNKITKKYMFFYLKENKKTITQTLLNELIKNNDKLTVDDASKYQMDMIGEHEITFEIEAMIMTDEYIEKENTIENGLNNKYYVIETLKQMKEDKQHMFLNLSIQKEILQNEYVDPIKDYENINGVVYQVKNGSNKKSYIGFTKSGKSTLKNKIILDYESTINKLLNDKNLDKYDKLLGTFRFKDLEIFLLEKREKKSKQKWIPEKKAEEYIKKYKSDSIEGYNTSLKKKDYMKKFTTINIS